MINILRHIIFLFIFLSVNATAVFCADAVYVNNEKIRDYIETLSQGHKSGGDKNADILKKTESIDGFIQGNIILWDTLAVDERKKRIKDFKKMLEGFYKTAKESADAERIGIRNEFSESASLIVRDIMKAKKIHVMLETDKKENISSGIVDITEDVIAELARYAKNKSASGAQEIEDVDSILYKIGYINAQGVGLREGDNDSKVIGLLSNEDVIVISFDKVYRLKVLSSRGIGYVKMQYVDIGELYGAAKK